MDSNSQHLVIVSGLSGAGKSTALNALEDMGYHCIDNLPASLMRKFGQQMAAQPELYHRVALGIDARAPGLNLEEIPPWLTELRADGLRVQLLFLGADDNTLVKRFGETRRKHPLAEGEGALQAAISRERELLEPVRASAEWEIDTGSTNIHQLRHLTWKCIGPDSDGMTVVIQSFGFSKGVPGDADFLFDVRSLPNPYWDPDLRALTGRDPEIMTWLGAEETVGSMADDIAGYLSKWLPGLRDSHRSFVTIGIGCTGGRHRSVFMAERIARMLHPEFPEAMVHHRDLQL
jgi:UPF0042 nucleotide-binding protein